MADLFLTAGIGSIATSPRFCPRLPEISMPGCPAHITLTRQRRFSSCSFLHDDDDDEQEAAWSGEAAKPQNPSRLSPPPFIPDDRRRRRGRAALTCGGARTPRSNAAEFAYSWRGTSNILLLILYIHTHITFNLKVHLKAKLTKITQYPRTYQTLRSEARAPEPHPNSGKATMLLLLRRRRG